MKNAMVRAWEIAKLAEVKHGGKAIEYIAQALKLAWGEIKKGAKKMASVILKTLSGSRKHKSWVAEVTGKHETYKFNRVFLDEVGSDYNNKFWKLLEGKVYEICNGGHRYFAKISNGELMEINSYEVNELLG